MTKQSSVSIDKYDEILSLKVYIGGYFQGHPKVFIDFVERKMSIEHSFRIRLDERDNSIPLNTRQIRAIRQMMRKAELLKWRRNYVDEGVMDGTQWSVEMLIGKRTYRKYGSNEYPEQFDILERWFHRQLAKVKAEDEQL
jgi:hypothetical protein